MHILLNIHLRGCASSLTVIEDVYHSLWRICVHLRGCAFTFTSTRSLQRMLNSHLGRRESSFTFTSEDVNPPSHSPWRTRILLNIHLRGRGSSYTFTSEDVHPPDSHLGGCESSYTFTSDRESSFVFTLEDADSPKH
jgi:hypothetical protein